MVFLFISVILTATYLVALLILLAGWRKALRRDFNSSKIMHPISVIVPVRNESSNILKLLHQLEQSSYPSVEVIVIDDHSTDGTGELVRTWMDGKSRFRYLESLENGKKKALRDGIAASTNELIVTTDGDCAVPDRWLFEINNSFRHDGVMLVFGGVAIESDATIFSEVQAIEFASLIGSGAALWGHGFPIMCNGANLAFRKIAFVKVNGYEGNFDVASGDDEFLMRKIVSAFPASINFMNTQGSVVKTRAKESLRAFMQQRFRWAGKWKHNDSVVAKLVAVYVFTVQLSLIVLLVVVFMPIDFNTKLVALSVLFLRAIGEAVFLKTVCRFLQVPWRWTAFLLLQLFYPIYVVVTGLFSNFMAVTWKNRRLL